MTNREDPTGTTRTGIVMHHGCVRHESPLRHELLLPQKQANGLSL